MIWWAHKTAAWRDYQLHLYCVDCGCHFSKLFPKKNQPEPWKRFLSPPKLVSLHILIGILFFMIQLQVCGEFSALLQGLSCVCSFFDPLNYCSAFPEVLVEWIWSEWGDDARLLISSLASRLQTGTALWANLSVMIWMVVLGAATL